MPSTTAARSTSATTGRYCSQPASISTPARRRISPSRAQNPALQIHWMAPYRPDNPFYRWCRASNYDAIWALGLAQPLSAPITTANRAAHHRRRGRQRVLDRDRRNRHRRKGGPTTAGRTSKRPTAIRLHGPGLRLSAQWTRLRRWPEVSCITGLNSLAAIRAALLRRLHTKLDQTPDLRRQRQCERRLQLRAARRFGRWTIRRHCVYDRRSRRGPLLRGSRLF